MRFHLFVIKSKRSMRVIFKNPTIEHAVGNSSTRSNGLIVFTGAIRLTFLTRILIGKRKTTQFDLMKTVNQHIIKTQNT